MRKEFPHTEIINREIMWLHAYGLQDVKKEWKRNEGIRAPNSGPCNLIENEQTACIFTSNDKFYSWRHRDKEPAKMLSHDSRTQLVILLFLLCLSANAANFLAL